MFLKQETKRLRMATKVAAPRPRLERHLQRRESNLAHERLSIVDVEHGAQPLFDKLNGNVLAVNGEIYNHKLLPRQTEKGTFVADKI